MLTKPTEEQLHALKLISENPATAPFLRMLEAENAAVISNLINVADEGMLRRMQGKAQHIHDILSLVDKMKRQA